MRPGCSGALARELARAYPSSLVTVLDLPKVIHMAREHFSEEGDTILFQEGEHQSIESYHDVASPVVQVLF